MDVLEFIAKKNKESHPIVVATLIGARGSAPQDIGAKAVFDQTGLLAGTVGGGKLEEFAKRTAIEMFALESDEARPIVLTKNLQTDIGMTCGGEVTLLLEPIAFKVWDIALFGAGHVAQALTPLLLTLNCRLKVIDTRKEWLDKLADHNKLEKVLLEDFSTASDYVNSKTFLLSITQGHSFDCVVLDSVFKKFDSLPFIGVIGSEPKANSIRKALKELDYNTNKIDQIICPVGYPIGSNDPAEISVSITAQLIEKRG